jgi:hypothetical protein
MIRGSAYPGGRAAVACRQDGAAPKHRPPPIVVMIMAYQSFPSLVTL